MKKIITKSPEETIKEAMKFAHKLKGGEIIGLIGELGSGKTTFVKGVAEELKVAEIITSPTFLMLKPYRGKIGKQTIEFVHVDAYRVETIEDIKSVGIEDYIGRTDVILVIEWADKIKEILPQDTFYIKFTNLDNSKRKITYDFDD